MYTDAARHHRHDRDLRDPVVSSGLRTGGLHIDDGEAQRSQCEDIVVSVGGGRRRMPRVSRRHVRGIHSGSGISVQTTREALPCTTCPSRAAPSGLVQLHEIGAGSEQHNRHARGGVVLETIHLTDRAHEREGVGGPSASISRPARTATTARPPPGSGQVAWHPRRCRAAPAGARRAFLQRESSSESSVWLESGRARR